MKSDLSAQSIVIHDVLSTHVKSVHGLNASTSEVTAPPTLGFCRPYTRALLPCLLPVADVQGTPETCSYCSWIPEELQTAFSDRTALKSAAQRPASLFGIGTSPRADSSVTDIMLVTRSSMA